MKLKKTLHPLFALIFIFIVSCNKDDSNPNYDESEFITFRVGINDYTIKSTGGLEFDFSAYDELDGYEVYFSDIINPETGEMGSYTFKDISIGDDLEITTNKSQVHCKVNHPSLVDSINTEKGYLEHDSQLLIPNEEDGVIVISMQRAQAGAVIIVDASAQNRVSDLKINSISVNSEQALFTTNSYFRFSYRDEFGTYIESQVTAAKGNSFIGNLVAKDNETGIIWVIEEYDDSTIIDL